MLNTSFIQSHLPNLQTQKQLLKDRFEEEKTNGYNFELVETRRTPNTVKFANRINLSNRDSGELEDREYSLEELDYLVYTLTHGLIDGIIREANTRNAKTIQLSYGLESMQISWGAEIKDSLGHVLFVSPHKHFNYDTGKDEITSAYLVGIICVDFNS